MRFSQKLNFATGWRNSLIFQTYIIWSNRIHILKYQRSKLDCKDMGIRKFRQRLKKSKQISEIILHKKLACIWKFFALEFFFRLGARILGIRRMRRIWTLMAGMEVHLVGCVISSDPTYKYDNARFTTVPSVSSKCAKILMFLKVNNCFE